MLGASNVAASLPTIVRVARAHLCAPVDLLAAAGKGRSYGQTSRFLGRVLPGISHCGLWSELARPHAGPTYALATDLGNDIAFGASAEQLQRWLEASLDRLAAAGARIVVTGVPLEPLRRLPRWELKLMASVLFPWHRIDCDRALDQAAELDARLTRLARERGLAKVDPRTEWYGHDPIHVRRAFRRDAWEAYAGGWAQPRSAGTAPSVERVRGRIWYERVRLFGIECGVAQPCARIGDASSLRLY